VQVVLRRQFLAYSGTLTRCHWWIYLAHSVLLDAAACRSTSYLDEVAIVERYSDRARATLPKHVTLAIRGPVVCVRNNYALTFTHTSSCSQIYNILQLRRKATNTFTTWTKSTSNLHAPSLFFIFLRKILSFATLLNV
jgi:hypothetical protein